MSDPLADLKRRAYARPTGDGDAAQAQAELARIERERQLAEPVVQPERPPQAEPEPPLAERTVQFGAPRPPRFAVASGHTHVALGVGALLAAIAAMFTYQAPGSLSVFDRVQVESDIPAADFGLMSGELVVAQTIRRLNPQGATQVYVFRTTSGRVCLTVYDQNRGASTCTPGGSFQRGGLALQLGHSGAYLTVLWGPIGDPRFYDVPFERADG